MWIRRKTHTDLIMRLAAAESRVDLLQEQSATAATQRNQALRTVATLRSRVAELEAVNIKLQNDLASSRSREEKHTPQEVLDPFTEAEEDVENVMKVVNEYGRDRAILMAGGGSDG